MIPKHLLARERLDNRTIIALHKELIAQQQRMIDESTVDWINKEVCRLRKRLWQISLFRNINGFDPPGELPADWEPPL